MKINIASYVLSAAKPDQYPIEHTIDFAFVGRSNVGKSSLINAITNHNKLCKTSKTPGRTQLVNFFEINKQFYFVDLPGYGYAKVPKEMKKEWGKSMERYLMDERYKVIFVLLDIRRIPSEEDMMILKWCAHYKISFKIVFTKCDKLSGNEKFRQMKEIRTRILFDNEDVFFHSSLKKTGGEAILEFVGESITEVLEKESEAVGSVELGAIHDKRVE